MTEKKKKRARRSYKDEAGNKLPSVTEILGGLGWKYAPLMQWANKIGREGKTLSEGSRDAMKIGTIAHDMIEDFVLGRPQREHDEPAELLLPARGCLDKFQDWWFENRWNERFRLLATEVAMVDRVRRYGGTADLVGLLDGVPVVLDYKTGKSVYAETGIQLAAYAELWGDHGYQLEVDADDELLSPEMRKLRKANRIIKGAGIIHVPVDGPVTHVEIGREMLHTFAAMWENLLLLQYLKEEYDAFAKSLRDIMKREPETEKPARDTPF